MMALRKSKPKGNSFPQGLRITLFLNYGFRKLARSQSVWNYSFKAMLDKGCSQFILYWDLLVIKR